MLQFVEPGVTRRKKNVFDRDVLIGGFGELESRKIQIFAEADEVDALALLGDPVARGIEHGVMNFVTQAFKQFDGGFQGSSFGVAEKILHVLEKENRRAVMPGDAKDFVQERAPGILESTLVSRDAEGLTGESSAEQIVSGNITLGNLRKVARRFLPEIFRVGKPGIGVEVGGKNASMPVLAKSLAKPADTAKEIYKSQLFHSHLHHINP